MSQRPGFKPLKPKPKPITIDPAKVRAQRERAAIVEAAGATYGTSGSMSSSLDEAVETPDAIVPGWLYERAVNMLYAPGASGKTWVAVHWACSIATGKPWQGVAVAQGPVWVLAAENPAGWFERVATWTKMCNEGVAIPASDLLIIHRNIGLATSDIEDLCGMMEKHGRPSLIIVDTLDKATNGRTKHGPAANRYIASLQYLARTTGAAILLLHHTGRAGDVGGAIEWANGMDNRFRASCPDGDVITAYVERARFGGEVEPVTYVYGETSDGEPWAEESADTNVMSDTAVRITSYVAAHPDITRKGIARAVLLPLDEIVTALAQLVSARVLTLDPVGGAYNVA